MIDNKKTGKNLKHNKARNRQFPRSKKDGNTLHSPSNKPNPPPPYPGCGGCVAGGVNLPRDRQEDPASEPWEPHLLSLSLDDD